MKNNRAKVYLVLPTIRNLEFLKSWKSQFSNCHLIVVEDNEKKTIKIPNTKFSSISHFSYEDIDKDLGDNSWIVSRRNAGIRSYGFFKAYQMEADVVITIDDDCYPTKDLLVNGHLSNLNFKAPQNWVNTYPDPQWMYTRGIPYSVRDKKKVMLSHGLWSGALDLDARTEIKLKKLLNEQPYPEIRQIIPKGYYYPMCSMNLAFRREIIPLMFFPMMGYDQEGKSWKYDRFDDIWAGIFSKKIMDHLNLSVINGSPFVNHRKASKPIVNHKKEKSGMKINEVMWKRVEAVKLSKNNPKDCYIELASKVVFPKGEYFKKLKKAMIVWANLF
jgi:hypothetical protein